MSHEIDTMMSVRTRPWHFAQTGDRTNILAEYPENWDDARRAAGILWEPRKRPVYGEPKPFVNACSDCGEPIDAPHTDRCPRRESYETVGKHDVGLHELAIVLDGDRAMTPLTDYALVERDDTGAGLAMVNNDLPLITHAHMGDLCDSFTEPWRKSGARIQIETMGSLRGGRNVWALIRLDEPFTVDGDHSATFPYAVMLNSHDGTGACKLTFTNVRVVCWNTWQAADMGGERDGFEVVIRHSGDIDTKIEDAKAALAMMRDNAAAYKAQADELAAIKITDEQVATFLDDFIPINPEHTDRQKADREDRRAKFMYVYADSLTSIEGTAYGLVQAAGEFLDHIRPYQSTDTYMSRTIVRNEPIKARAITKIREMVALGA